MRFSRPTAWPVARRAPRLPTRPLVPAQPRQLSSSPSPSPSSEVAEAPPVVGRSAWMGGLASRGTILTALVAAGAIVVLLYFGVGSGTDTGLLRRGWAAGADRDVPAESAAQRTAADKRPAAGTAAAERAAARRATAADEAAAEAAVGGQTAANGAAAERATEARATADEAAGGTDEAAAERAAVAQAAADKAAAERAAVDKATAQKMAAARAADARAAAHRAAEASRVVAMPALVGLKLNVAMNLAEDAGLTAVTVCRTPGDDIPLWWSNWRITGQDVPPGKRVDAGRRICVSAAKN